MPVRPRARVPLTVEWIAAARARRPAGLVPVAPPKSERGRLLARHHETGVAPLEPGIVVVVGYQLLDDQKEAVGLLAVGDAEAADGPLGDGRLFEVEGVVVGQVAGARQVLQQL